MTGKEILMVQKGPARTGKDQKEPETRYKAPEKGDPNGPKRTRKEQEGQDKRYKNILFDDFIFLIDQE